MIRAALSDNIYDGKEQEGLVWYAMVSDLRITVPALVGPELPEHLEVFLKRCVRLIFQSPRSVSGSRPLQSGNFDPAYLPWLYSVGGRL